MKTLWQRLSTLAALSALLVSACGSSPAAPAETPAPTQALATAAPPTEPAAATEPPATSPTSAPAAAASATPDTTRKVLDLSRTTAPGSTLTGTPVEQIIFGEKYDQKKNEVLAPAFVFPVTTPKVLFAFGVSNGAQAMAFTETLTFNGEAVPLPVTKFTVPPSGAGQKQLRVKGLAVKAGAQFPVGKYEVEVYAAGHLAQRGVFEVRERKGSGLFGGGRLLRPADQPARLDLSLFVVTEEEIEVVPEAYDYYAPDELQRAYTQLDKTDELYDPFPPDIERLIMADNAQEAEAACAAAGGELEAFTGQCAVADPAAACLAGGGFWDANTEACSFGAQDSDGDGWNDSQDNCPMTANPDQADADQNGLGDACELTGGAGNNAADDSDGDGWADSVDNCPAVANPGQQDSDGNGLGDACDAGGSAAAVDSDGDGWPDAQDNCPAVSNPGQEDSDSDGVGDVCDASWTGSSQADSDGDGVADSVDNCPSVANPGQEDVDANGVGDACEAGGGTAVSDSDGDGIVDSLDNCPSVSNPGQEDADGNGVGDACEPAPASWPGARRQADGGEAGRASRPAARRLSLGLSREAGGGLRGIRKDLEDIVEAAHAQDLVDVL